LGLVTFDTAVNKDEQEK